MITKTNPSADKVGARYPVVPSGRIGLYVKLLQRDRLAQFTGCAVKDQDLIVLRHHAIPAFAHGKGFGLGPVWQCDAVR